jgi:hypothetical protein
MTKTGFGLGLTFTTQKPSNMITYHKSDKGKNNEKLVKDSHLDHQQVLRQGSQAVSTNR